MKILIAALLFGLFFVAVEALTVKIKPDKEISRKTVHITAGIAAAFLPLFMSFHEIVILSLLFIPVMLYSKKANILSSIHQVKRRTYGEVFFPFAILITALVFPDRTLYIYGLLIMAISDGLASLIGQKYGKRTFTLIAGHKSYIGSLTFFATAIIIGTTVLLSAGTAISPALSLSVITAAALTMVEASLSGGLDNLFLPPVASGLLLALLKLSSLR